MKYYLGEQPRFEDYAACLGALEAAKLDLWERKMKPYEKLKQAQNGDVW